MADSQIVNLQQPDGAPQIEGFDAIADPILPPSSVEYRLRHFADEVWDLSPESHLVRLAKVMLGDAGVGRLRKAMMVARLRQAIHGTHFFDLDRFYGALFGLRRSLSERLPFDPYDTPATPEEWDDVHARDASYRSRIEQFARAVAHGPTPVGMELMAEAVLNVDCEVWESWPYADATYQTWDELAVAYPTWGDMVADGVTWGDISSPTGGTTAGVNRREFVIRPRRPITEAERYDLTRVISRMKPVDAIFRIEADGVEVHDEVSIRGASADSEHWEVRTKVVAAAVGPEQPYLVQSPNPEEQPNSPFVGYQGEAWTYVGEIMGITSHTEDVPNHKTSGDNVNVQQLVTPTGGVIEYSPRKALVSKQQILAGRIVSDGILAADPYPDTRTVGTTALGDFYTDSQGNVYRSVDRGVVPLSGIAADRIPLADLATAAAQLDSDASTQDAHRMWSSPEREQTDSTREVLEFRLTTLKPINYIAFEVAHYPHTVQMQTWDDALQTWKVLLTNTVVDAVPSSPVHSAWPAEHPQHYGPNHWVRVGGRLDEPIVANRFRLVLTRGPGTPPTKRVAQAYAYTIPQRSFAMEFHPETYNTNPDYEAQVLATHTFVSTEQNPFASPGFALPPGPPGIPGGWFLTSITDTTPKFVSGSTMVDAPTPYSLAVRGLDVGYRVTNRDDLPLVPTALPMADSTDLLGNKVEFHVREYKATNLLADTPDIWKCEPQPISDAVVSLYLDVRNDDSTAQVIDRLWLDPVHPGCKLNVYHSSEDPNEDFAASDRELGWGPIQVFGTITDDSSGNLVFTDNGVSYVEASNSNLQWDATIPWWVGMTISPQFFDTAAERVLYSADQTVITFANKVFRFETDNGEFAEVTGVTFVPGQTITIMAVYTPSKIKLSVKIGATLHEDETTLAAPLTQTPTAMRIGAPMVGTSAAPAFTLRGFVLKQENWYGTVDHQTYADTYHARWSNWNIRPGVVGWLDRVITDTFWWDYRREGFTLNALLRFDRRFRTDASPYGFRGGPGYAFEDVVWTPVFRDYTLQRGYLFLPPTKAKYLKLEFTKLIAQPYEVFIPQTRQVKVFPPEITLREAQRSLAGSLPSVPPGASAAQALNVRTFVDSITAVADTPVNTADAMVPTDPVAARRLADRSYVYGYQTWHLGSWAPQFTDVSAHRYERIEIEHVQRMAYFVGLKAIKAYRINYQTDDNSLVYIERFFDEANISSTNWESDGRSWTTGALGGGGTKTMESKVFPSLHAVSHLQYATVQSQPEQIIYDDDFRDPNLGYTNWTDSDSWHIVGSAYAAYLPDATSVKLTRFVDSEFVTVSPTHGIVRPIVHEIAGATGDTVMPDQTAADSSFGGLESHPLVTSGVGMVWAAVRLTARSELTSPLLLQIIRESDGSVLAEKQMTPTEGVVHEAWVGYEIGSIAPSTAALRVRVIQQGESFDAWEVDALSMFDEGIKWSFSVDGGDTWVAAHRIRNNPHGVLTFPAPGRSLKWKVEGGRPNFRVLSLKMRPWYENELSTRPSGPLHGPNVSVYDTVLPINEDPEWSNWDKPIPRGWFIRYRQTPLLGLPPFPVSGQIHLPVEINVAQTVNTPTMISERYLNLLRTTSHITSVSASSTRSTNLFRTTAQTVTTPTMSSVISVLLTFTSHPLSQAVADGGNATFGPIAVSGGGGGYTYQWQQSIDGGGTYANIVGATSASYNTGTVNPSMDGRRFRCRVTSSLGGIGTSYPGVLTVDQTLAPIRFAEDGLTSTGATGTYAKTGAADAITPTNKLWVTALVTAPDYSATYTSPTSAPCIIGIWNPTADRCWKLTFTSSGDLQLDLSTDGTTTVSLTYTPGTAFVDNATYLVHAEWDGALGSNNGKLWASRVYEINNPIPAPGSFTSPNYTGTVAPSSSLFNPTPDSDADLTLFGTTPGNFGMFRGNLHYVAYGVALPGAAVFEADFRTATIGGANFTDTAGGRVVTLVVPGSSSVGMPAGEAANVGPMAGVLGHTPLSAWSNLATQVDTLVITDAMAATMPSVTDSEGVARRRFTRLNVFAAIDVQTTTPIELYECKYGMAIARANANVLASWCDEGRSAVKTGDTAPTSSAISALASAASRGSGANLITLSAGKFTEATWQNWGQVKRYRCQNWGQTKTWRILAGSTRSESIECWTHDLLWMAHDPLYAGPNDTSQVEFGGRQDSGCGWITRRNRIDTTFILSTEFEALAAPAFKGAHWSKVPTDANWPLQRAENPGTKYRGIAIWNLDQPASLASPPNPGKAKNFFCDSNIIAGQDTTYERTWIATYRQPAPDNLPITVALTSGGTTITVASTSAWPAAPFTAQIESEQVRVTAKTATTFTVTRGYNGSTAASHAINTPLQYKGNNIGAGHVKWATIIANQVLSAPQLAHFTLGGPNLTSVEGWHVPSTGANVNVTDAPATIAPPIGAANDDLWVPGPCTESATWGEMLGISCGDWVLSMNTTETNWIMTEIANAGFTWVRIPVYWHAADPNGTSSVSGTGWNWNQMNRITGAATAAALKMYGMVGSTPTPLSINPTAVYDDAQSWRGCPATHRSKFGVFCTAVAHQFPQIRMYCIWNEPNLATSAGNGYARFWKGESPNSAALEQMQQIAYTAFKTVDPSLTIIGGTWTGARPDNTDRWAENFGLGLINAGYYDGLDVHPYSNMSGTYGVLYDPVSHIPSNKDITWNSFVGTTLGVASKMAAAGFGGRKIIAGEIGHHTANVSMNGNSGVTEAQQITANGIEVNWWSNNTSFVPGEMFYYTALDHGYPWDNYQVADNTDPQLRHGQLLKMDGTYKAGRQWWIDNHNNQWGPGDGGGGGTPLPVLTWGTAVTVRPAGNTSGPCPVDLTTLGTIPAGAIIGVACTKTAATAGGFSIPTSTSSAGWVVDLTDGDTPPVTSRYMVISKIATGSETSVDIDSIGGNWCLTPFMIVNANSTTSHVRGTSKTARWNTNALSAAIGPVTSGSPAETNDIAIDVIALSGAFSTPTFTNGHSLGGQNLNNGFSGGRVLTSDVEDSTASWVTGRNGCAGQVVYKGA